MHYSFTPRVTHALPISPSLIYHPNNIWQEVQVLKLLLIQFSPTSCYFLPLVFFFNIFPASYCQTPSSCDCFLNLDQVSLPHKTTAKITFIYTAELSYNDLGLCYISTITLYILWYKLIPHKAQVFQACLV